MPSSPSECANCGADVPPRARACPECGADERTGWAETSIYDGLNLPDEAEEDQDGPPLPRQFPWYWWVVGIATLLAFFGVIMGWS